jgi:hypothetical protein
MHILAIMHHRILSFDQEDRVEIFSITSLISVQLNSPSALISRLLELQFSNRIV